MMHFRRLGSAKTLCNCRIGTPHNRAGFLAPSSNASTSIWEVWEKAGSKCPSCKAQKPQRFRDTPMPADLPSRSPSPFSLRMEQRIEQRPRRKK